MGGKAHNEQSPIEIHRDTQLQMKTPIFTLPKLQFMHLPPCAISTQKCQRGNECTGLNKLGH